MRYSQFKIVERDTVGVDLPEDLLKISKLIGN